MTIVYSTDFTVAATTPLEEFPSAGSPDFQNIFGALALSVDPTQDAVYIETGLGTGDFLYRVINASAPTGDYEVAGVTTVRGGGSTQLYLGVRCAAGGGSGYWIERASASTWQLWRIVAGSWDATPLATYSVSVPADSTITVKLKVTGTNPVVVTATINGAAQTPYSDSSGTRLTSGTAGVGSWLDTGDSTPYLTSLTIDDLAVTGGTYSGSGQLSVSGAAVTSFTSGAETGRRVRPAIGVGALGVGPVITTARPRATAGGGTTYTYNASGQLTLSGSPPRARTKAFTPTGTVTVTGSPPRARTKAFVAAGAVQTSGGALWARAKVFGGSGAFSIAGSALWARTKAFTPSGTVTATGVASTTFTGASVKTYTGTGQLTSSGAAALTKTKAFTPSGSVSIAGSPPLARTKAFNAAGSLLLSGAALVARAKAFLASGQLTLSGAAITSKVGNGLYVYTGAGQLIVSGAATKLKVKAYTPSGGVSVQGSASLLKVKVYLAAGGVLLSGAAPTSALKVKVYLGSGLLQTSGAALVARARDFRASGNLLVSGTAPRSKSKAYLTAGAVAITGGAILAKLKAYTPSGIIAISGAAETSLFDVVKGIQFAEALIAEAPARKFEAQGVARKYEAMGPKRDYSAQVFKK